MTKTFTQNDLIRYIYGETSLKETVEIEVALTEDPDLMKNINKLLKVKRQVASAQLNPSDSCINKILSYSASLNLEAANS